MASQFEVKTTKEALRHPQGILGHTSVKTTEIYLAYLTPDQQQAAKLG